MSITVDSLFQQAKLLPDSERVELAQRLYDTVPLPEMPTEDGSEEEADAAWQDELGQRLNSIADGTAELIDGEQVFAELRAHHRTKGSR